MLSDAQIERWSRQILVPEVGGRGQARLCAARVEIVGRGGLAAALIERAGPSVTTVERPSGAADVVVRWTPAQALSRSNDASVASAAGMPTPTIVAQMRGARALVTTVGVSPCAVCVVTSDLATEGSGHTSSAAGRASHEAPLPAGVVDGALARVTERTVAALVASEVVRLLVVPDAPGRVHHVDLANGTFTAEPARASETCTVCGAAA